MANRSHRRRTIIATGFCLLISGLSLTTAQEYRATLTGRVTDEQAAALPGVTVVATHIETGTRSETVTDGSGLYTFPLMPPGDYSVAAEITGFARMVRERVPIGAGQRVAVDLTMTVGSFNETITVTAERTLLQTASASQGLSVEASQIESLPLSGRAPSSLVKLAGGVADLTIHRPIPARSTMPAHRTSPSAADRSGRAICCSTAARTWRATGVFPTTRRPTSCRK